MTNVFEGKPLSLLHQRHTGLLFSSPLWHESFLELRDPICKTNITREALPELVSVFFFLFLPRVLKKKQKKQSLTEKNKQ